MFPFSLTCTHLVLLSLIHVTLTSVIDQIRNQGSPPSYHPHLSCPHSPTPHVPSLLTPLTLLTPLILEFLLLTPTQGPTSDSGSSSSSRALALAQSAPYAWAGALHGSEVSRAGASVPPRPPQYLQVPTVSCACTSHLVPRALLLPRPLQHLQVPAPSGARAQVHASHGQWCSRAHLNTSRCPFITAPLQVAVSHAHSCSRAHRNASRCPP